MKTGTRLIKGLTRNYDGFSWNIVSGPRAGSYCTDRHGDGLWRWHGINNLQQERGHCDWSLRGLSDAGARAKVRREFMERQVGASVTTTSGGLT